MHLATVTAYLDWLAGLTSAPGASVNELLLGVPRLPGDAAAPEPVEHFADPFRDDKAAAFAEPPKGRAIYVHPDGPVSKAGEASRTFRDARSVAVGVRIIVRSSKVSPTWRWCAYVAQAVEQSTALFLEDDPVAQAARARLGVTVWSANQVLAGSWNEAVGSARALAMCAVDFQVRDANPRG